MIPGFFIWLSDKGNPSLLFDLEVRLQWCSECLCVSTLEAHLSWILVFSFSFWLAIVRTFSPCFPFYDLFWLSTFELWVLFYIWAEWTCLFFLHSGDLERGNDIRLHIGLCWLRSDCFWSYILKSVFGIPVVLFCSVLFCGFSCIWVGVVAEVCLIELVAELFDVFWGSLVNREFRPFALKTVLLDHSFRLSSAMIRLVSFLSYCLGTPGEYDAVYDF